MSNVASSRHPSPPTYKSLASRGTEENTKHSSRNENQRSFIPGLCYNRNAQIKARFLEI